MSDNPDRLSPRALARFAVVLAVAGGAVWWFTRTPGAAPAAAAASGAAGGHDHATMGGSTPSDVPRSVQLGAGDAQRIGVTFAVASAAPVTREIRLVGDVRVDETRQRVFSLKVDGWVESLALDFTGRPVRRGEPMLALYSPMLVSAQEELLLALRLGTSLAGSPATPAGGQDARAGAQALVDGARRRLRQWDVSDATIQSVEETGRVIRAVPFAAPASGVVIEKNVVAGQQVMAGQPLFRVTDLSVVWVEGAVFEQDLGSVHVGQRVTAEFRSRPGEQLRGTVRYIYPTLDPATRTARVRAAFANADGQLKPGMVATLRVQSPGTVRVVSVPRSAVLTTGERSLVFVKGAGGMLVPHLVTLGASSEHLVEILSGLSAGDTVVASGTFLLDAESNLGTVLGGMGDMPGMDMSVPVAPREPAKAVRPATPTKQRQP